MLRAIYSGDVDEVLRLLEADPTLLEKEGGVGYGPTLRDQITPVVLAASVGKLDMVKLLVGRGANIHTTSPIRGMAALHCAAEVGHEEVVVYLLDNGADPMRLDKSDCTPIMRASERGHLRVVLLLLEHTEGQGLETGNIAGYTALHKAIEGRHEEVVAELLRHGARADTVDNGGNSALSSAVDSGLLGVVKLLVDHLGTQALHERDPEGRGLLHHAAFWAEEDMVAYLVGKGLQPSITDNDGMTPLMYCAKRSGLESIGVLERLLSYAHTHELDMRNAIEGKTALHWAVQQKRPANVRALLVAGADPSIVDNEGRTPRILAIDPDARECVAVFEVGTHM
jgi:ankyrin repeat protein